MPHRTSVLLLGVVLLAVHETLCSADPLVQRWGNLYDQGAADTDESATRLVVDAAGNVIVAGTSDPNRTRGGLVVHKYNRNTGSLL